MGMSTGGSNGGTKSEINVTPFVDVVLVLLIIFMVLTPLMLREIGVVIPRKADQEVTADIAAQQVVLHVKTGGALELGGVAISQASLADRLHAAFANKRRKLLFVRIDDEVNYGHAVEVMDTCRGAGVQTLGMTTN